jgi:hypothetical protein
VLANAGGYANEPALTIANDVIMEMLSDRYPWKWNRFKLTPFYLNALQQDYILTPDEKRIGWLENGFRVDMSSTQVPPPAPPVTVVRDLSVAATPYGATGLYAGSGFPRVCWMQNDQLEHGEWPGPGTVYSDPSGLTTIPDNHWTQIEDDEGNILVLTKYGTTGTMEPVVPDTPPDDGVSYPNWPIGAVVVDGSCEWTVADPSAQGIRMEVPQASNSNLWLMRLFAQKKAPVYTNLQNKIDPVPDDEVKWFRDGFIAYCHRYSANPAVKAGFEMKKQEWFASMATQARANNREDEGRGFFPAQGVMSPQYVGGYAPGYPFWRG